MRERCATLVSLLGLLALSSALAQAPTLNLEFGGDVYLSHVSDRLDGLPSYRQRSLVTTSTPGAEGEPSVQTNEEGRAYLAATGEWATTARHDLMPGFVMVAEQYLVGGRGYVVGGTGDEVTCNEVPAEAVEFPPLDTGVSDATGFKSATLAAAGETMNGLRVDRYTLDDPPYAGRFEDGSLEGQAWIAREGGFLVRYDVTGTGGDGVTVHWTYDLVDVGTLPPVTPPEGCAEL